MPTVADLIDITRHRYLLAGHREDRNRLAVSLDETVEELELERDPGVLTRGSKLSIGLEDMYVWGSNGLRVDVDRGQFGTTARAHDDGARIIVNARPSPAEVLTALNETVTQVTNGGVFRVLHVDLESDGRSTIYPLDVDPGWIAPFDVRVQVHDGPVDDWPAVHAWEVTGNVPTDTGDTVALRLHVPVPAGQTIRLRYKAALTPGLVDLDDDVSDATGLEEWAVDILPLGAALALIPGREVARNRDDIQGDTRRAGEVPPNSQLVASRGLLVQYETRLAAIRRRLHQTWPMKMRPAR